jgi:hypothetical protein
MRTTITLTEDDYRIAKTYAVQKRISMSKAINEFVSQTVSSSKEVEDHAKMSIDPLTKLPLIRLGRTITLEDVKKLEEDEDLDRWKESLQ